MRLFSIRFIFLIIPLIMILIIILYVNSHQNIKIGFISDFANDGSEMSIYSRNAAIIGIEDLNKKGGVHNRKFELIVRNITDNNNELAGIIEELVKNNVKIIIGPSVSRQASATLKAIKDREIIVISPTISSIESSNIDDNFFKLNTSARDEGTELALKAIENGNKSFALIWSYYNNLYTGAVIDGARETLIQKGYSILIDLEFTNNEDSIEIANLIKLYSVDGVIFAGKGDHIGQITQQISRLGINCNLYANQWSKSTDLLEHAGRSAEGMIIADVFSYKNPDYLEFSRKFYSSYKTDPVPSAVLTYDTLNVIFKIYENIEGRVTASKIKKFLLEDFSFEGLSGNFRFNKYGDAQRDELMFSTVVAGEYISYE
ncbi:MAG: ABC transporter substrate-binding protein [Spirochaetales bacterium]|nr:ABC transporter substrate-binding protein [Spirochaetales bacterium]